MKTIPQNFLDDKLQETTVDIVEALLFENGIAMSEKNMALVVLVTEAVRQGRELGLVHNLPRWPN